MIKLKYSSSTLYSYLLAALLTIAIGLVLILIAFFYEKWPIYFGIGQLAAGIFILLVYFHRKKKGYFMLKNGKLIKNSLITGKIKLADILSIKQFAGDMKFKTAKEELIIDTKIIDPNSLAELNKEINKYNLN